ncbi:unnamed protein product, partial [Discosporangium mesarthrocarpum]
VRVSHVSLQHSFSARAKKSAPWEFRVLGWACDPHGGREQPVVLVEGEYQVGGGARVTQVFNTLDWGGGKGPEVGWVTLEVLSNHGEKDYTCLYGFRVHGEFA